MTDVVYITVGQEEEHDRNQGLCNSQMLISNACFTSYAHLCNGPVGKVKPHRQGGLCQNFSALLCKTAADSSETLA